MIYYISDPGVAPLKSMLWDFFWSKSVIFFDFSGTFCIIVLMAKQSLQARVALLKVTGKKVISEGFGSKTVVSEGDGTYRDLESNRLIKRTVGENGTERVGLRDPDFWPGVLRAFGMGKRR